VLERVVNDPKRYEYTDLATAPMSDNELKSLDLFHETAGGEAAVEKMRRQDELLESLRVERQSAA
jgi:hypothetical protein